MGIFS
jgi:hypothetical protein